MTTVLEGLMSTTFIVGVALGLGLLLYLFRELRG